jgi:hypothetical protein
MEAVWPRGVPVAGVWPRTGVSAVARRVIAWLAGAVMPAGAAARAVSLTGAGPRTARPRTVRPWNLQMAAAWRSGSSSGKAIACIALMATSVIKPSFELYCVRSLLRSIVFLFERKSYYIVYIVVSRGSDIFGDTSNRCLGYRAKNASL